MREGRKAIFFQKKRKEWGKNKVGKIPGLTFYTFASDENWKYHFICRGVVFLTNSAESE